MYSSNSAQYISFLPQEEVFTSHAITFCATCFSQLIIMNIEIQSSDYQLMFFILIKDKG